MADPAPLGRPVTLASSGATPYGLVTDVIEFSAVDGPGNRFVVFLQGCNFDCVACHNPYTINVCIDCGECLPACPSGALFFGADGRMNWDEATCHGGDQCIAACPYDSTPKARPAGVEVMVARIRPAAPFLSGVTVSGGEATTQWQYVRDLFTALGADTSTSGLTRFVDSNGHLPTSQWDALASVTDGVMVDLKCLDPTLHRKLTGQGNDLVLASIEHLQRLGLLYEIRLLVMVGVNDSDDLMRRTGDWLAALDPAMRVKVLGFRRHGVRPSRLLGGEPTAAQREHYADVLRSRGDFVLTVI